MAILQDHPPTPAAILPPLRAALSNRVVVEQAQGYLREYFGISLEDAFTTLRHYAHTHDGHLSEMARRIIRDPAARQEILADMTTTSSHIRWD